MPTFDTIEESTEWHSRPTRQAYFHGAVRAMNMLSQGSPRLVNGEMIGPGPSETAQLEVLLSMVKSGYASSDVSGVWALVVNQRLAAENTSSKMCYINMLKNRGGQDGTPPHSDD